MQPIKRFLFIEILFMLLSFVLKLFSLCSAVYADVVAVEGHVGGSVKDDLMPYRHENALENHR
jgi:hypothetical protein